MPNRLVRRRSQRETDSRLPRGRWWHRGVPRVARRALSCRVRWDLRWRDRENPTWPQSIPASRDRPAGPKGCATMERMSFRSTRWSGVSTGAVLVTLWTCTGCAPATTAVAPPTVPAIPPATRDQKMTWTVRLEHQRVLRDEATTTAAGPVLAAANVPDLVLLLRDPDPSLRHRAALAIGRVGMADGIAPLTVALSDPEPDVRAIAAFALGLIGDTLALPALQIALADPSPVVRGRAIEALGLIADPSAAPWVAQAAAGCGPLIAPLSPDDEAWPKSPEIELCRLALFSLARLRQLDALAQVAIDATGQPVSKWWPVAFALSRVGDPRGAAYLPSLATGTGVYTASFALRGLALAKHPALLSIAVPLLSQPDVDIKLRVAAVRALAASVDHAALAPLVALLDRKS